MEESSSSFIQLWLELLAQEVPRVLNCRGWGATSEKVSFDFIYFLYSALNSLLGCFYSKNLNRARAETQVQRI